MLGAALGWAQIARADAPERDRIEPAGLPVVAGSTDIGVGAGVVGSLAGFSRSQRLWRWRLELQLFAAAKRRPSGGLEVPYQEHILRLDLPRPEQRLRWTFELRYFRDATQHYYGIGNASSAAPRADPRYYQLDWSFPSGSATLRHDLGGDVSAFAVAALAYSSMGVYRGSKLEQDRSALFGTRGHGLGTLTAGFVLDTRDDELSPAHGMFHDLSFRVGRGVGESFGFAGVDLTTRYYASLVPHVAIVAVRFVLDALFGHPPVYELWRIGGLVPQNAPGGGAGVRGIPIARYSGKLKAMGNLELRSGWVRFGASSQPLGLGAVAFFDTGFLRSAIVPDARLDGRGLDLKYGTGGGLRLAWGRAFVARLDAAWSPDGVGFYLDVGQAF